MFPWPSAHTWVAATCSSPRDPGVTPRVVATDLDGTVIRSDGTISDRTRTALTAAADDGALVVIVTGRPPRWLGGIADATGHHGLAICANGALVYDLTTETVIGSHPIDAHVVREVVAALRAGVPGIGFAIERVDGKFAHESSYHPRWTPEPNTRVGEIDDLMASPMSKLLARVEGISSDELLALAREVLGADVANLTHSSIDGLLEVSAVGITKAATLAELVSERGLSARDVVAFGDMPNDIEMIQWAGLGVGVANAHPDVLAVADEVTASNDEDGVAQVLERWFAPA
ncbi:MAG: HAD family phosphatase [Frankiaceae bacterium]|nr:HAD family phosphatase [Frankiaceae bacterium]MBV9871255.1 HAD family phosphatase [Frankiaceae bacterium]